MTDRSEISHAVLYTAFRSSGTSTMLCTEPSFTSSALRIASFHLPSRIRSRIKCLLTTINSPASVLRLNTLL